MDQNAGTETGGQDLMALADELLIEAAEIRRQWAQLASALDVDAEARAPSVVHRAPSTAAEDDPRRLVALDMLLSGRTRDEVTEHLIRTFGAEGVKPVVDTVFSEYDAP
jgi:hypothetical protein